jgi:hypothetical protein
MRDAQKFWIFDSSNPGFLASLVSAAFTSFTRRPVGPRHAPAAGYAAQNNTVGCQLQRCGSDTFVQCAELGDPMVAICCWC